MPSESEVKGPDKDKNHTRQRGCATENQGLGVYSGDECRRGDVQKRLEDQSANLTTRQRGCQGQNAQQKEKGNAGAEDANWELGMRSKSSVRRSTC